VNRTKKREKNHKKVFSFCPFCDKIETIMDARGVSGGKAVAK
jgi:hypothetical protein